MRTTIDISDKHRISLLSLAAQRGLRGYSRIIEEALDYYLSHHATFVGKKKEILKMKGSWKDEDTTDIISRIEELRGNWNRT